MLHTLDTITLDEMNKRAAMLTRVDRKYVLTSQDAESLYAAIPREARILDIGGNISHDYASTYFDTPAMDSYALTALKRRRRFKVRTRSYCDSRASFLEVKTRGPRSTTVKKRIPITWGEAGAPLRYERRQWVQATLIPTGHSQITEALEPVLDGSYTRSTLLLPNGEGRATIDTNLKWASRLTDRGVLALPSLVIIETKSGATPSSMDRILWERGFRPIKISKYATAMAALHRLPAHKWHRTLERYFQRECGPEQQSGSNDQSVEWASASSLMKVA